MPGKFLSTLSLRRATGFSYFYIIKITISIHALLAESDLVQIIMSGYARISIHALLAESDAKYECQPTMYYYFYPRSPCGERQQLIDKRCELSRFLSTLSLRRATKHGMKMRMICINFYPRSPCGERHKADTGSNESSEFLSTLSLRRATTLPRRFIGGVNNFYPRSPCGERPLAPKQNPTQQRISIHALLAESDFPIVPVELTMLVFLSTLSLRRATVSLCYMIQLL